MRSLITNTHDTTLSWIHVLARSHELQLQSSSRAALSGRAPVIAENERLDSARRRKPTRLIYADNSPAGAQVACASQQPHERALIHRRTECSLTRTRARARMRPRRRRSTRMDALSAMPWALTDSGRQLAMRGARECSSHVARRRLDDGEFAAGKKSDT